MRVRRSTASLVLGLGLAFGPAAAASASADYPPTPSGTITPSVLPSTVQPSPTPTEDEEEAGVVRLPRTGGEMAVVALAGAALVGAGGVTLAATRRRGARA